eukprot:306659-Prymnesium_polylepis.1
MCFTPSATNRGPRCSSREKRARVWLRALSRASHPLSVAPGERSVTVTADGASSCRRPSANERRKALLAPYSVAPGSGASATRLPVMRMRPRALWA